MLKKTNTLKLLRVLDNWKLYQTKGGEFLLESPSNNLELFDTKAEAEKCMLYSFFGSLERSHIKLNKTKPVKRKKLNTFHKNRQILTNKLVESMPILDSKNYIRFLDGRNTVGMYVVFNGRLNTTLYAPSYQMAERFFKKWSDNS